MRSERSIGLNSCLHFLGERAGDRESRTSGYWGAGMHGERLVRSAGVFTGPRERRARREGPLVSGVACPRVARLGLHTPSSSSRASLPPSLRPWCASMAGRWRNPVGGGGASVFSAWSPFQFRVQTVLGPALPDLGPHLPTAGGSQALTSPASERSVRVEKRGSSFSFLTCEHPVMLLA